MDAAIDFSGIQSFIGDLKVTAAQMQASNHRAFQNVLLEGEAIAKANVPRVTGFLFGGISNKITSESATELTGVVGDKVVYGPMVNYGAPAGFPINYKRGRRTKNGRTRPYVAHLRQARKGKPFLDPTLSQNMTKLMRPIEVEADRIIKSLAK